MASTLPTASLLLALFLALSISTLEATIRLVPETTNPINGDVPAALEEGAATHRLVKCPPFVPLGLKKFCKPLPPPHLPLPLPIPHPLPLPHHPRHPRHPRHVRPVVPKVTTAHNPPPPPPSSPPPPAHEYVGHVPDLATPPQDSYNGTSSSSPAPPTTTTTTTTTTTPTPTPTTPSTSGNDKKVQYPSPVSN